MKILISTLFATLAVMPMASAAQALLIHITIIEQPKTIARPTIVVDSGKEVSIQSGKIKYVFTPILRDDGTVEVSGVLSDGDGTYVHVLGKPGFKAKLDQTAELQTGDLVFQFTTSLAKRLPG